MSTSIFFEFLQVAVGNRETLSCELSDNDWKDIFLSLKKQALLGIGFSAVEKLHTQGVACTANLRMKWMALVVQREYWLLLQQTLSSLWIQPLSGQEDSISSTLFPIRTRKPVWNSLKSMEKEKTSLQSCLL